MNDENKFDHGPPGPPILALLLATAAIIVACFAFGGCAVMGPPSAYDLPMVRECHIPVYIDGRLDHCTDAAMLAVEQRRLEDGRQ